MTKAKDITIVSSAAWIGEVKGRDQKGTPAIIEIGGVRFFSLSAKDQADADRINKALEDEKVQIT